MTLRVLSSFLLASLLLQQVAFADPDLKPLDLFRSEKLSTRFSLPESVAWIEDSHKAPVSVGGRGKTVYLIQDAHTNVSGQLNIAKTLEAVMNAEPVRTVYLEAGSDRESLESIRGEGLGPEQERVALGYLRRGELQGVEYHNLFSKRSYQMRGVEDPMLYKEALEAYRALVRDRGRFQAYLDRVEAAIKTLKPRIYNSHLLRFDSQRETSNNNALTDSLISMLEEAARQNIRMERYPHLLAFSGLKEQESRISFNKADDEQARAIGLLSEGPREELLGLSKETTHAFKISSSVNGELSGYFARLGSLLGEDLKNYPELSKYIAYLKTARKIDLRAVLAEERALEAELYEALSRTEDEKILSRCAKNVSLLRKILGLSVTPEEYAEYSREKDRARIAVLTGFLNQKISELGEYYENALFIEPGYEEAIRTGERFYELTRQRDEFFIDQMTRAMDAANETHSVLVVGGYHAANLKSILKSKDISYVSIVPQIYHETNLARYEKLLIGQNISHALGARVLPGHLMLGRLGEGAWDPLSLRPKFQSDMKAAGARLAGESIIGRLESAIGTEFRDKEILARLANPTENKSKNKFAQIFGDAIFKLSFIDYALGRRAQIGEANLEPFRKYVQSKKWKERILDSIDEDLYEAYQRSSVQPYTAESLAGSLMGALIVDGRDLGMVKDTADTFLKKYFERALHTLEPVNVQTRTENAVHGDYLEEIEELSGMLEPYLPRETSARSILASKIKPANSRLFPLELAEEARLGDAIISVIVYAELWKKFGFNISYESLGRIHDHIVGDPNLSKLMIHWSDPDAPKTRVTHREAKYEASLFEALVSAVYEANGGAQGHGFETAKNLIFSELQEYLREGGSIGYEGADEFVHSVDTQGARLADGSRRKKSQTADARAVEFYKFNRELIRLFTEFNDTKKSGRSEDAFKVIDAVRDYSPLLDAYIQEIREADKAGQAVLDSFASRSREELKEISQKLAEQVRSFAPNFEAAHIIRDQNELDRLNREVLPLLKQRLKIQLIRLRSELRAAKIAQGPIFMILASVIGLYRRISYEHTWADRRLRGQEILSRFQMGDATGHLVFNLFYEKEPVIRVERKSDGKIKLSQIIWKYVDVPGGKQALKPVLTPIGFEALEKAFRSRIHALVSQEEEFAQLVYHDLALQDTEQTLESYQNSEQGGLPVYLKDQIQHSIESVLEGPGGKRGLRRKYASVKDQKGDVLPMPGPTLEAAAVSVGSGDLKTALQLVQSARKYIDRRMTAIERTKDATVRKRDYVYLLIRDQALLAALKNLKNTLEAKPLALERLDAAATALHTVLQTYYRSMVRDLEYKRTQRMIQSYLGMIETLESQAASSSASGKDPILLPGFTDQVNRAIQSVETSLERRRGARLALKEYLETSEFHLVEAGRVVQKALALPPLTLMNIHASLEDYLENLSEIRSRFNGIYFDDPALLAMEVLDPLAHLRFSMIRFLVISRAFPPLAEIRGKSPSGILIIKDHTDTFAQHMANATLSVLNAHDWAQKVSGKQGARLALESAASILLWELRQADKKAFARAAWDALGPSSFSAPLFAAPWRKAETSLERLSVLSSYDTLSSAALLESFRVADLVASHLLERGLDYGLGDPDLYESADRYLRAYFEYVLVNGDQVKQSYESVRSDDPKLLEALKEYYENDYDYLSGARLSHEDELEDNLALLAQAIYEGRESASKILAIARGHFRQGLKGLDPNPFSRAQMHRNQENYRKALLVAISSAFRKGEWARYISWRYEFITHFSEEDPAFRAVDQGVDPEHLDKVFDIRSTAEWMDRWSGIREMQELLLSGARLATDDRENDFKKIRKGLTFFAREAETLIVELSLEGTAQPKVTERFLEDLEYLEERLQEIQDVVLWEEKEKTYEIFTDIWQTLIVLEESKDLLGKRLDAVHIEKLFTAWARNAGPSYELRLNVFFASYYTQMALRLVTGQELLKDLNGFLKTKSSVIHLYSTMITEIDDYVVLAGADDPSGWKRLRRRLPEWLRVMDRFESGVHSAKKYYRKGAFEKIFYDDSDLRKAGDYLGALSGSVDRALDEKRRGARLAFDRTPSFESEISLDPPDSRRFANALRPLHEALGSQHIEYPSLNGTEGKVITALVHGYALLVGMPYIAMPLSRSFRLLIHWEAYDLEALKNRDMRLVEAAIHNWTNFPEADHSRQMNFVIQQLFKYLEHHDAYVRSVAYVILKELSERMALLKDTIQRTVSTETGAIDPSLAYQGRVNGGRDSDFDDINDPNRYKVWSSGARLAASAAEKKAKIERTVHTLWASKRKFGDFKNLTVPYVVAKVPGMGELLSRLSKIRQTGQRNEIFGELFAMDFIAENILKDAVIVGTNLFIGPSEVDVVFLNAQGLWVVEAKEFFNHDVEEQIRGVVTGQAADQAKNADYLRRLGIPVFHIVVAIGKNVDAQEAPVLNLEPSGNGSVMYSLKIRRDVEGHNAKILPKPTDRQMAALAKEEMRILRLLERYAKDYPFLSFLESEEKMAALESEWKNTIEKNRIQKKVRRKASLPKKLSTYDYNDNTKEANGWISSFQRAEVVSYDEADISNARDVLKDYFDYALSGGTSKMSARFELQNRFNAKPAGPFLAWKWLENGEYRTAAGARLARDVIFEGVSPDMSKVVAGEIVHWYNEKKQKGIDISIVRADDTPDFASKKVDNEITALETALFSSSHPFSEHMADQTRNFLDRIEEKAKLLVKSQHVRAEYALEQSVTVLENEISTDISPDLGLHFPQAVGIAKQAVHVLKNREDLIYSSGKDGLERPSDEAVRKHLIELEKRLLMIKIYEVLLNLPYGFNTEDKKLQQGEKELAATRKNMFDDLAPKILSKIDEGKTARYAIQATLPYINGVIAKMEKNYENGREAWLNEQDEKKKAQRKTNMEMFSRLLAEIQAQKGYLLSVEEDLDSYNYLYEPSDLPEERNAKVAQEIERHKTVFGSALTYETLPSALRDLFNSFVINEIKKGRPIEYAAAKAYYHFDKKQNRAGKASEKRRAIAQNFLMRYYDIAKWGVAERSSDKHLVVLAEAINNESDFNAILRKTKGHGQVVSIIVPKNGDTEARFPHWYIFAKHGGIIPLLQVDLSAERSRRSGIRQMSDISPGTLAAVDGKTGRLLVDPAPSTLERWMNQEAEYEFFDTFALQKALKPAAIGERSFDIWLDEFNLQHFEDREGLPSLARRSGGEGVGLLRMEELVLEKGREGISLDEERLSVAVDEILSQTYLKDGKALTVRVYDVQGDKGETLLKLLRGSSLTDSQIHKILKKHSNVRFYLDESPEYRDFREYGKMQLRALFKAHVDRSPGSGLRILFPNVLTPEEIDATEKFIDEAKKEFLERASTAVQAEKWSVMINRIPIGYMIEEVSSVNRREEMLSKLKELKERTGTGRFVAIGTSDLLQSVLRQEGKSDFTKLHPRLLQGIAAVAQSARKRNLVLTVDGEWANSPLLMYALISIDLFHGLKTIWVPQTTQVPAQLEYIRHTQIEDLEQYLKPMIDRIVKGKDLPSTEEFHQAALTLHNVVKEKAMGSHEFKDYVERQRTRRLISPDSQGARLAQDENYNSGGEFEDRYADGVGKLLLKSPEGRVDADLYYSVYNAPGAPLYVTGMWSREEQQGIMTRMHKYLIERFRPSSVIYGSIDNVVSDKGQKFIESMQRRGYFSRIKVGESAYGIVNYEHPEFQDLRDPKAPLSGARLADEGQAPAENGEDLIRNLASPDKLVWMHAAHLLKKRGLEVTSLLMRAIREGDDSTRKRATELLEEIGSDSSTISLPKPEAPLTETIPLTSGGDSEYALVITLKRPTPQELFGLELTQTVKPKTDPAQAPASGLDREFDGPVKMPSTVVPTSIRGLDAAKMTLTALRLEAERRIASGLWKDPVEGYIDYVFWVGQNVKSSGARLAEWKDLSLGERQELLRQYVDAPLDDEAIALLVEGLKENFRATFSEVEKILINSNDPRVAKKLLEAFEDQENKSLYYFRARAARVLGQISPVSQRALFSLAAATKDSHAKVAAASVEALGRIDSRDPLIVKSLWEASRSRRATVRQAAKKILDARSREQSASGARLAEDRKPDTQIDLSGREADLYALRIFRDSYLVKFEQKIDAGRSAEEALKKMDDMFGEKGDRKKRLETLSYLVYGEILTERELTFRIDQRKTEDLYVLKSLNRALNVVFKRAQRHGGKFTFKKLAQTYQSYLERHNKAENAAPTEADIALLNRILNFVEGKMPLNAKVSRDVRIAVTDAMDDSKLGAAGVTNLSSVAKGDKLREALAQLKPHILVVRSATKVDEALIDKLLPDLKVIIRGGHGLDNVDADYARLMDVEVYGTQGSEHAVAAWALRAIAAAEQQGLRYKEDAAPQSFFTIPEWTQALEKKISKEKDETKKALLKAKGEDLFAPVSRDTIESLKGKTIGIIGFGAVGRQLAAAAKELGMRVLVNTPTLEKDPLPALKAGYEAASKEAIYKASHYIVPLTGLYLTGPRKNAGMIGQAEADLMLQNKNLIALVNPDREGLVDEMAITRLIEEGGVQYLVDEVPDSDILMKKARYTPHIAASTEKAEDGVVRNTAALLARIYPETQERISGARLAKEEDPSLVSTQITQVRHPSIYAIAKRIHADGGFQLLFKKSEVLEEAFKDALDDFEKAAAKDPSQFFGPIQEPSQEHFDIAFVEFIRRRSQADPDILGIKFKDTSDWFLRAFPAFSKMTFDKVFSEQSRSRILYDESDEGPSTEAKRYLAGYFLKKGLAKDHKELSETPFSKLVPAILDLSRSALMAERRLFMKTGAHPAIQTAILVDKLESEPTFASYVEGVLQGARLAGGRGHLPEKDLPFYAIRLEDQGEGRWISIRDDEKGSQTRYEFQVHKLSDATPQELKEQVVGVYLKLANRLDRGDANMKLLYTDPRRGNDTIFLTSQARVAGLYNLGVKDSYVIGFVVDRAFQGSGAADVLLEEMVRRHLGGDRSRSIKGVVSRDSDRAQTGRFRGTVDLFKNRLGMRSVVTITRDRTSETTSGARLSGGQARLSGGQARLSHKKDSVRFLVNVYNAQKREGEIALGDERLQIAVRPKDRALVLYGLGDKPVAVRNYRMIAQKGTDKSVTSLELSISELRQALGQDTQAVDAALGEIDTRTPVVAAIDLGAFSTPDSKETIFPLLVRELYAARRQNAVFTLKGSASEVDAVLSEASKLYGARQDFIYRQGEGLPEAFRDARRVVIAGASAAERGDAGNERLLLVKNLERGELPNLKAVLKTALFEARVEKLESTDPQFVRLLNAYRILLGNREISDLAEFITVLEGNARDLSILQKYMIAPKPIAYDAVLRVYALMIKMAEQSA